MKKGYRQPYIRHCKTSLFSEKGEKQKTRKIYFQHSQHNKINDLLLYHHNVLRVSERAPTTIPPIPPRFRNIIKSTGGWAKSFYVWICATDSSTTLFHHSGFRCRARVLFFSILVGFGRRNRANYIFSRTTRLVRLFRRQKCLRPIVDARLTGTTHDKMLRITFFSRIQKENHIVND